MKKVLLLLSLLCMVLTTVVAQDISLVELGRYTDGRKDALEIVTYDSTTQRLFITNAASDSIDIIDLSDPANPSVFGRIDIKPYGGGVNSVVVLGNGYIAAAIEDTVKQNPGKAVFFDTDGNLETMVTVGALPDMITVSPDGMKVLTANEGEPNADYDNDPNGSISIINIMGGVANLTQADVTTLEFMNAPDTIAGALKKPDATYAQDLEPEYIAVTPDGSTAVVVCQESNVAIIVNLAMDTIMAYVGLGFKDHSLPGNGLDASNRDDSIIIKNWPVKGVYQPDAIAAYAVNGLPYFVTANEGDGREYDGYVSETRIKNLTLDSMTFPNAATLQDNDSLGRLKTFTIDMIGDTDGDGDVDELYSYGARSFSIWNGSGQLVWDSGDQFEQYIAANHPAFFNCNNGLAEDKDERSDDKGPEPEAVAIGEVGGKYYAFIGLERQGGIMVYNISNPVAPYFVEFVNSFQGDSTMTDISPEGLIFVSADDSPTDHALVIVSHEISGTTTIYQVDDFTSTKPIKEEKTFKIFPNPTHQDLVYFGENKNVTVFDILGKQIARVENTNRINTAKWGVGSYIFVTDEGQKQLFIKVK